MPANTNRSKWVGLVLLLMIASSHVQSLSLATKPTFATIDLSKLKAVANHLKALEGSTAAESMIDAENLRQQLKNEQKSHESMQQRFSKAIAAGFRYAIIGAAIGMLMEFASRDPEDIGPFKYTMAILGGSIGFFVGLFFRLFRYQLAAKETNENKKAKLLINSGLNDEIQSGMAPIHSSEDEDTSLMRLLRNSGLAENQHDGSEDQKRREPSRADPSPVFREYTTEVFLQYVTSNSILPASSSPSISSTSLVPRWTNRIFLPDPNLASALQLEHMGQDFDSLSIVRGAWCDVLVPATIEATKTSLAYSDNALDISASGIAQSNNSSVNQGAADENAGNGNGEGEGSNVWLSGKVLGRVSEEGLIWNGDSWINKENEKPFRIVWPKMALDRFEETITGQRDTLLSAIADPQSIKAQQEQLMKHVVQGETLPGHFRASPSTFGIYYVEDTQVMGFHRDDIDWGNAYHVTIVAKNPDLVRTPLQLTRSSSEYCSILEHMNRAGQCFFVVNRDWILDWYHVPRANHGEVWAQLLQTLVVGFDVRMESSIPWLALHVILGTPTAEGIHPHVMNHWLSLQVAMEYAGCPEPKWYVTNEDCHVASDDLLDDELPPPELEQNQDESKNEKDAQSENQQPTESTTDSADTANAKDANVESDVHMMRFACGVPEAAEPNGAYSVGWRFPVTAGNLKSCRRFYWVSHDEEQTVYFKMSEFTHTDRTPIKNVVQDGPGWERRDWEDSERTRGNFVGPVEQRSRGVQVAYWDDPSSNGISLASSNVVGIV